MIGIFSPNLSLIRQHLVDSFLIQSTFFQRLLRSLDHFLLSLADIRSRTNGSNRTSSATSCGTNKFQLPLEVLLFGHFSSSSQLESVAVIETFVFLQFSAVQRP